MSGEALIVHRPCGAFGRLTVQRLTSHASFHLVPQPVQHLEPGGPHVDARAPSPAPRPPESASRTSRSPCPARATGARPASGTGSPPRRAGRPAPPPAADRARRFPRLPRPRSTSARTSASSSSTFAAGPVGIRPVEAHAGGAILEPEGAVQGGQVGRQPVHDAVALPRLHPLPALALARPRRGADGGISSSRGNLLPRPRSRMHHAPRPPRCGRAPGAAGRPAPRAAAGRSPARMASSTSYASSIRYGRSDSCVCAASHSQRWRRSFISSSVSVQSRLLLHRLLVARIFFSLHMIANRAVP